MSKSSVRKRGEKLLASKMGMYNANAGSAPVSGHKYTKPGSKK